MIANSSWSALTPYSHEGPDTMKTPKMVLALSFLAITVLALSPYVGASGGGARIQWEFVTRAILGAGVSNCDQGKGAFHAGWTCLTTGTFACDNVCDVCPQQTAGSCPGTSCWECSTGQITEGSALAGSGFTDMGNTKAGTPCNAGLGGSIMSATCTWTGTACSCPGVFTPGAKLCPRYDCL